MKFLKFIILILFVAGGFFAFYYSQTYVGSVAYAKTPSEVPEMKPTIDMDGKTINGLYSYKYKLTFVSSDGHKDVRDVEISSEKPTPLQPNSYVKAKLSKKRVTEGPTSIDESSIPKKTLDKLQSLND